MHCSSAYQVKRLKKHGENNPPPSILYSSLPCLHFLLLGIGQVWYDMHIATDYKRCSIFVSDTRVVALARGLSGLKSFFHEPVQDFRERDRMLRPHRSVVCIYSFIFSGVFLFIYFSGVFMLFYLFIPVFLLLFFSGVFMFIFIYLFQCFSFHFYISSVIMCYKLISADFFSGLYFLFCFLKDFRVASSTHIFISEFCFFPASFFQTFYFSKILPGIYFVCVFDRKFRPLP